MTSFKRARPDRMATSAGVMAALLCASVVGVGGCGASAASKGAAGGDVGSRGGAGGAGGVGGAGGAPEIDAVAFDLPARHYVFDSAAWGLPATGAAMPAIACASAADCCAPASMVGLDCRTLICDASGACAAQIVPETPPQQMNLLMEVPVLSSLDGKTLADVSISHIRYNVVSTLSTTLPPAGLYLAPAGATSTNDPQAKKLGTVPSIPAAWVSSGDVSIEPDGAATLGAYARDPATTFTLLARTTVTIAAGEMFPAGTVDVTVTAALRAKVR